MDYKQAGVDIDAGHEVVRRIRSMARGTFTQGVLSDIGSFGGLFRLDAAGVNDPVLVASADGVGTKLRLAFLTGVHRTIGIDLVNHCVNDILVQGARPLFFLDYLATGRLEPEVAVQVVEGLAAACSENGCALLGGETAEMPGFYADGEYDVAGFIVGAVARDRLIDGKAIRPGDALIGVPSSGLHTNGYSLAQRIVFDAAGLRADSHVPELGTTIGAALLVPHRSYLSIVGPLLPSGLIKGMAHITGGGITDNLPRILPAGMCAVIDRAAWQVPPLFQWLQRTGHVPDDDMLRTFNMGIGLIVACSEESADTVIDALAQAGESRAARIGRIVSGDGEGVRYRGQTGVRPGSDPGRSITHTRIGVLISGRGSTRQALIDMAADGTPEAQIVVVISNKPNAAGLDRARAAGIETLVIDHRGFASRDEFDATVVGELRARHVSLVCLAGFMRLVGPRLLDAFPHAILNVHPSLLPAFPGVDAQRQALEHGVKVTGATVHLVTGALDGGPIVLQSSVPVREGDSVDLLSARILIEEHRIYPEAVRILLDGRWRVEGRRFLLAD